MYDENVTYDDTRYIKRNPIASFILIFKAFVTFPFNLLGIFAPEKLKDYSWILYIEAFHHYHARIFYLLAVHRNILHVYCAGFTNGLMQKKLIMLEACFDVGLICLYTHEYFALHNFTIFFTPHVLLNLFMCLLSIYALRVTSKIKIDSIA